MAKGCRPDNEEALWQQELRRIEKDAEGYHLEFSLHSENYRHLTFPEGIA